MSGEQYEWSGIHAGMQEEETSIDGLMQGLFLGSESVVRRVQQVAQDVVGEHERVGGGYDTDNDELEPAEHWHRCLREVRQGWEGVKQESPWLYAWYREPGHEGDNRKHLESVLHKLGDMWRARDYLLSQMDSEGDDDDTLGHKKCDLTPMALFMLAVVRAEELEEEGLKVTRAVRAKYGDEMGLPQALEGLLGGQRSVAWWLRETEVGVDCSACES